MNSRLDLVTIETVPAGAIATLTCGCPVERLLATEIRVRITHTCKNFRRPIEFVQGMERGTLVAFDPLAEALQAFA